MITFRIDGAKETREMLKQQHPAVQDQVSRSIARLTLRLLTKVKKDKLTGQVLKNKSGKLRRSINLRIEGTETSVVGYVGTNVEYARAHEFGFNGEVTVKAHLRKIKKAFGKQLLSPKTIQVSSYSRHVNLPERSFLRSALKEMEPEIREKIARAVMNGVRR